MALPFILKSAFFWPTLALSASTIGGVVGFEVTSMLRPLGHEFIVTGNSFLPDVDAAMEKYEAAKGSGDYGQKLTVDEMINVTYRLFAEETHTWTQGVGSSLASIVNQSILSTTVRDGERYFEESISSSAFVSIYDRMYREGDLTTTYWGSNGDFASHPKDTMPNDVYAEKMGRNVAEPLIFVVSPTTLIQGSPDGTSGERATGIYPGDSGGYEIEAELSPIYGTYNYKKQMQNISNLKTQPEFRFCHITVKTDKDLNLLWMGTHNYYRAVTSAGVGSWAEEHLNTAYHHEAPPFPFPEVGDAVAEYPPSV